MTTIHMLATHVCEEADTDIAYEDALEFIQPLAKNFNVSDAELVRQAADALDAQFMHTVTDKDGGESSSIVVNASRVTETGSPALK